MPKRTNDGISKRCDCPRRTWPKCVHPWHFNFHYAGKEHRYSLDAVARREGSKAPTSKAAAMAMRDRLRSTIRGGELSALATAAGAALTFGDLVDRYRKGYVNVPTRRQSAADMFEVHLRMLLRAPLPGPHGTTITLRDRPIDRITKADVEAIRAGRREELATAAKGTRRAGVKQGEVGINRLLARLRHLFNWAIAEGYVQDSPFKRGTVTVVKLEHKAETVRSRRLQPGEEAELLKHATPHLRAIITAALSTGCRLGELLTLQWSHVRFDADGHPVMLALPAAKTKTNQARVIPVGSRLRAILEMRRNGPDGVALPATAHVFGNEVGEPVTSVRAAWEATCAAAGITDLHVHDLRREFACRLLESSASLHDVRDFLGHANVTTTSAYLASSPVRLGRALERMEAAEETPADSHTVRTKDSETTNGRSTGPAVTH